MQTKFNRWRKGSIPKWYLSLLVVFALAWNVSGQPLEKKDIVFPPQPNELDPDAIFDEKGNLRLDGKIWVLEFKLFFREVPFRSIKVNVPGRGERIYYYLLYGVSNPTNKPRTFVPNFDLVVQDTFPPKAYRDEILPKVQEAIRREIDPRNVLDIKSSVEIYKKEIPVQKPNALKRWTYGVAIWTGPDPDDPNRKKGVDVPKKPTIGNSNYFSIFVSGLSNGLAETDHPRNAGEKITRVKTLQINFKRKGDAALRRDEDVVYHSHRWFYRTLDAVFPKDAEPEK